MDPGIIRNYSSYGLLALECTFSFLLSNLPCRGSENVSSNFVRTSSILFHCGSKSRRCWGQSSLCLFISVLLSYNWQNCKIFKVCNMMIWYMYIWKYSPIELINTYITSHIYYFFLLIRTFIFQLKISIIQYNFINCSHHVVRSSNLTHLISESLHPLINLSLFPPPCSLATTCLLCFYV